jgi:hypothetical protein
LADCHYATEHVNPSLHVFWQCPEFRSVLLCWLQKTIPDYKINHKLLETVSLYIATVLKSAFSALG